MNSANKKENGITVKDLKALQHAEIVSTAEGRINNFSGVSIDSRTVQPGELFFAIKGERHDSHKFLSDAVGNGAAGIVVSKDWDVPQEESWKNVVIVKANDTRAALGKLANIHRRKFAIPVIGITGTNGKTTTKEMTAAVLEKKLAVTKTPGNFNNQFGLPLTLFMLSDKTDIAVVELGASYPGEIAELCEIAEPSYGIITNVGKGHLEFFKSVEEVVHTKTALLSGLPETGTGFVNGDDPNLAPWKDKIENIRLFGMMEHNDIRAENITMEQNAGYSFTINGEIKATLRVPGKKMIYNALAAAAVGMEFNVDNAAIGEALSSFTGYSQRMETLAWKDVFIINDSYNANPDSMAAALELLQEYPSKGRKFAVLGDMLELGSISKYEHEMIGREAVRRGIDRVITVGNDARYISETANITGFTSAIHTTGHAQAARLLTRELKPGDVLLVKGSRGSAMEKTLDNLLEKK